jgi:hypothetical protein
MLSSPIIFFYGFFVLLVFVIGVAPTDFWRRFGGSLSGSGARWRQARMNDRFVRAAKGANFTPDVTYVPDGIGFALDSGRGLVFVAGEQAGRPGEALLPLSSFRACATGVNTGGFAEDNYLDLLPTDTASQAWRISCGTDVAVADTIAARLAVAGLPRA